MIVGLLGVHFAALSGLVRTPAPRPSNGFLMFLAMLCPILFLSVWFVSGLRLSERTRWLDVPLAAVFLVVSLALIIMVSVLLVAHPVAGSLTGAAIVMLLMYLTTWA